MYKKSRLAYKAILVLISLLVLAIPTLTILADHMATFAAAEKSAAAVEQGGTTQVQIRIPAPSSSPPNIEISVALDASGSMASSFDTMKNNINDLVDWVYLKQYQSRVKLSVLSFSKLPCPDEVSGTQAEKDAENLRYANPRIDDKISKVLLSTTTAAAVKSTIGTFSAAKQCSGESQLYGFTDITAGLNAASNKFTTSVGDANNLKYLVLLSDGFQNMPASGSGGNSYSKNLWAGTCALKRQSNQDVMNITRKYDFYFGIYASGQSGNLTRGTMPGVNPYTSSCESYLAGAGNMTGQTFMGKITAAFPSSSSLSLTTVLGKLQEAVVQSIYINDYLNTGVFTSATGTISDITVHACNSSATSYGDAVSALLSGSNNRIFGTITYTPNVSHYCIRFKAKTRSDAAIGSQYVNLASTQPPSNDCTKSVGDSHNVIRYRNGSGNVLRCDVINLGSVNVVPAYTQPTLSVPVKNSCTQVTLSWSTGSGTSGYNLEYKKSSDSTWTSINMGTSTSQILTGLSGDTTYNWRLLPRNVLGNKSYINGTGFKTDSCYSAPTLGNATNITCNSVTLSWTAGVGGYSYTIKVYPKGSTTAAKTATASSASTTSTNITGLSGSTEYEWSITPNGQSEVSPKKSFTTNHCYTAPTKTTLPSATCSGASVVGITLGWNQPANSGVNGYTLQYRTNGTSAWTSITLGTVTSYNLTGLSQNTTYNWQLVPKYYGVNQTPMTGDNFTTPYCLSYSITTPSSILIEPGGAGQSMTYNFTFTPNAVSAPTAWNGRQILFIITDIVPSAAACPAFNLSATPRTTGSHSSTSTIGVGFTGMNLSPSASQQQVIIVSAGDSTAQGNYKICYQARPNNATNMVGTYNIVGSNAFTVQYSKWLQIGKASSSISAGDVHSNGNLSFRPPYGKYLFNGVNTGLVSSVGANSIPANKLASVKEWRIPNYQSTIKTPTYTQLVNTITNNLSPVPIPRYATTGIGSDLDRTLANTCASDNKVIIVQGNAHFNSPQNTTSAPNCRLVYLINGDLNVTQNIIMTHQTSGVIYIVRGDILVNSPVSRLDGIYIFGGKFIDGQGSSTLTVNGSLIGLAGNSPNANTGSFLATTSPVKSGFGRDLGSGNNSPAETIIYQPKYLETFKALLGSSTITWTE